MSARFDVGEAPQLMGVGNVALLAPPLLCVICSRACPGRSMIETIKLVPGWAKSKTTVISGFHSPLEQQVLHSLLRRNASVIKVLARGMGDYRPPVIEQKPLEEDRMLVISALPSTTTRTTRAAALKRNRLVIALSDDHCIPHLSPDSPLREFVESVSNCNETSLEYSRLSTSEVRDKVARCAWMREGR
jgi:predicted Rossmann fold nucleotide-binding protein DprA/Smf involved in DNA uptake